jgi:hypothetical protein
LEGALSLARVAAEAPTVPEAAPFDTLAVEIR